MVERTWNDDLRAMFELSEGMPIATLQTPTPNFFALTLAVKLVMTTIKSREPASDARRERQFAECQRKSVVSKSGIT
jgi:hypothetical protein